MKAMRESTLAGIGLGSPLDIFIQRKLPASLNILLDEVFGQPSDRGALVISGGSGIVGSGKAMQLGARLMEYDIPVVTLDLPGAPDGLGGQYSGLRRAFGDAQAAAIMANVTKLHYDGSRLPSVLKRFQPRFVLEAIPEVLKIKKAHYSLWREAYPGVEIRSVTSGFPASELGVGILHPSFPHTINKVWEVVEKEPSKITQLLWAMGLIPMPVGDHWSFILDVLFCGVTLAAIRYHRATNMPYWKVDKYVRRLLGPNPLRAHDAIGPGASFLTWSCLHHLAETYGALFEPDPELTRRKSSGEAWYLTSRPVVDWKLDDEQAFQEWLLGPILQMTSLLVHERRASLPIMNAIGELCAQFSPGSPTLARKLGVDRAISLVEQYHRRHPVAGASAWHPDAFDLIGSAEWSQLYVNAEHNGTFGVITLGREAINSEVIAELNRAVDWLKAEEIDRVILTSDFHLTTQLVGADTMEFYPALDDESAGYAIARDWSKTARRLHNEFAISVGFIHGKRCLGGMLELMAHCHYLVAASNSQIGMPEVTLPVVPGMEGSHWMLRRCAPDDRRNIMQMLLEGQSIKASEVVGWLVDYAGEMEDALTVAHRLVSGDKEALRYRRIEEGSLDVSADLESFTPLNGATSPEARKAIADCIRHSCASSLSEALEVQARHSAAFMCSQACRSGAVGQAQAKWSAE